MSPLSPCKVKIGVVPLICKIDDGEIPIPTFPIKVLVFVNVFAVYVFGIVVEAWI